MPDQLQSISQDVADWLAGITIETLPSLLWRIVIAVIILLVGRWLVRRLARLFERWLSRSNVPPAAVDFFGNLATIVGLVIVVMVALGYVGVPMGSLIAVLAALTLAIGLAVQDSISNVASGLLIVILRPYDAKDLVQVGEDRLMGRVESINFFHTELRTAENSFLLIPNSNIMSNPIQNFTRQEWRRIDMEFGIGYDDDVQLAKQVLEELVAADERITKEPATVIAVSQLAASTVNLVVQPFVRPQDYLAVKYDLTEQVKVRFDQVGISLPYPMRTIYVEQASS